MYLPEQPDWLDSFKGSGLSFLECEALAVQHLDLNILDLHWQAQATIWFDYVRLHPVKALYLFAHEYGQAYGRYLSQNIEHGLRFSRGLKGEVIVHREVKSLLALKLQADRLGVPYPFFFDAHFAYFASNGWTRPPRPSHMATSEEAGAFVKERWSDAVAAYTRYARDPWFTVDRWEGHKQQERYEEWVINNIRLRGRPELALSSALYEMRALRIEAAVTQFREELVREAIAWNDATGPVAVDQDK